MLVQFWSAGYPRRHMPVALPLLMTIAMTVLEVLVAFLQAYVFTMLTCMYLNRALHPGH
jgi:F-type H+-transporting ATPase subunit a